MLRFRPAFCFTLRPGLAVVPLADLVMRFTRRSSMATQPWLLVRSVVSLWVKSCRRRACRARSLAISAMVRRSRLEYRPPLWRLAHLTCRALRRSRPSRRRCSPSVRDGAIRRGSGSSDTNAEHATPKSTPQPGSPFGGGPTRSGAQPARGPDRHGSGDQRRRSCWHATWPMGHDKDVRGPALVRLLFRGSMGGTPLDLLRAYIDRQNRPT